MKWVVGVTTVPERAKVLLPRTLQSLRSAGFIVNRLFVDGDAGYLLSQGLPFAVTERKPKLRAYGNWILGLAELLIRHPSAARYAMFQDDVVAVKGLRPYLETYNPPRGYLNLYTHQASQLPGDAPAGATLGAWREAPTLQSVGKCGPKNQQTGLGALGLVLNRAGVIALLSAQSVVKKPLTALNGHRCIDGAVVTAMNASGYREMIHSFSLIQHTGNKSTLGNSNGRFAQSFPGEDFMVE